MARDITVQFADGSSHVYKGAPDDVTPEAIVSRAQKEFPGQRVAHLDGGKSAAAQPDESPDINSLGGSIHFALQNQIQDAVNSIKAKVALGELSATAASGFLAKILSGWAGMGTEFANAAGLTKATPADAVRATQGALTIPAITPTGKDLQQGIGETAQAAGNAVMRQLPDNPMTQTAVPALADAALSMAGAGALEAPLKALADFTASRVAPETAQAVQSVVGKGASPAPNTAVGGPQAAPQGAPPPPAPVSPPAADAALAALRADNMTPEQLAEQLAQARASGRPVMPVDVGGPNLQGLVRQTVTIPGPGRQITTDALNARAAPGASLARVRSDASAMAGNPTEGAVKAAYAKAMAQGGLDSPELNELLEGTPAFKDAHESFGPAITAAGETPPAALFGEDGKLVRAPTPKDIDIIKRAIDNKVKASRVPGAVPSNQIEALNALKTRVGDLLEATDKVAPDYAAAREVATRAGRLAKVNKTLSQAADTSAYPDLVKPVAGTSTAGARADALAKLFGPDQAAEFLRKMQLERQMNMARNNILGGPNTASKLAEAGRNFDPVVDAMDVAHAATHPVTGLPRLAMKVGIKALAQRQEAAVVARNTELARGLASPGADADAFIEALKRRAGVR